MPFRLTGSPASWQSFINDLLWEYLNDFCIAYLDDILIYSMSMKKHYQQMHKVLRFHVSKTKYLGVIISTKLIKIDPSKVDAIKL